MTGVPSVYDHLDFAWRRRTLIVVWLGVAAVVSVVGSLLIPDVYRSQAVLLVSAQAQSPLDILTGGTTTANLMTEAFTLDNSNIAYVGFLKSRDINERIAEHFDLQNRYEAEDMQLTLETLSERTIFSFSKENLLVISVEDEDPKVAAEMASAYIDELLELTQKLDFGKAGHERDFLEELFSSVRKDLTASEIAVRAFQQQHGVIRLETQVDVTIRRLASLEGQLRGEHIFQETMRLGVTSSDGSIQRSEVKVGALEEAIEELKGSEPVDADPMIPLGSYPDLAMRYAGLMREFATQQTLFELVGKQLMLARIREERQALPVQIVESPRMPTQKSSPKRKLIVLASLVAAGATAILWAYFVEGMRKHRDRGTPQRLPLGESLLGAAKREREDEDVSDLWPQEDPDRLRHST